MFFLALLCCCCSAIKFAPKFELNLDKPPRVRWAGAVDLIVRTNGWAHSFQPFFDYYAPMFARLPPETAGFLHDRLKQKYPTLYEEVEGLAEQYRKYAAIPRNFNMTNYAQWVWFYEIAHITINGFSPYAGLQHSCSATLALPLDRSLEIIHGRNMDIVPFSLGNLTLHVVATKNNKVLYEAFTWAWVVAGYESCARQNKATVQWNWREDNVYTYSTMIEQIQRADPLPQWQRNVMELGLDFEAAIQYLLRVPPAAPLYIIMTGLHRQAAILTLSPNATRSRLERFNDSSREWFVVQANSDRWMPYPSDPRWRIAEETMRLLGRERGATSLGVWLTMTTFPVQNAGTIFTLLLNVSSPSIEGYVHRPTQPLDL